MDLTKNSVLVLNRNWQAIDTKTVPQCVAMLCTDVATALDIQGEDVMQPVKWADWLKLPVREGDDAIVTVRGPIRAPTVMVLSQFSRVPLRRPRFSARALWQRDGGVCQYTKRKLKPGEGNVDHVHPRSKGGQTSWDNCVLAAKDVNSLKADRFAHEVGLRLIRKPEAPRPIPATALVKNIHQVPDWDRFLL